MAENKKPIIKSKVIHLNERKRATLNIYKGKVYVHFADQFSRKTLTFTALELKKMKKIIPKLLHYAKKMELKKNEEVKRNEKKMKCDYGSDQDSSPYMSCTTEESDSN